MKRKVSKGSADDKSEFTERKKQKKQSPKIITAEERERKKSSLYRLPTSEEINELKENENLYKNNLFKMQLDYLLEEVCMNEKKINKVNTILKSLEDFLKVMKPQEDSHALNTPECVARDVASPLPSVFNKQIMKGKFQFLPPENVKIVGSFFLKTLTQPNSFIDVAVEIPKNSLQQTDNLNYKYLFKRSYYFTWMASHLKKWEHTKDIKYSFHGNAMKPCLQISLSGKIGKVFSIRLLTSVPADLFKQNRFAPLKNNVRANWYDSLDNDSTENILFPTPYYNSSILRDMLYESHLQFLHESIIKCPALKDAICLLKVWLQQRSFTGVLSFNGFIASMMMGYLLSVNYISSHMSSYQIFRLLLSFLATHDLSTKGITLCNSQDSKVALLDFHNSFDVVFVDASGYLNLLADVDKITYNFIRSQAKYSIEMLDDPCINSFECLFIKKLHFLQAVDHSFRVKNMDGWKKKIIEDEEKKFSLIDFGDDWTKFFSNQVLSVLTKGLDKRMKFLIKQPSPRREWGIRDKPPEYSSDTPVFGIGLSTDVYDQTIIMGPSAEQHEAKEFREFWGNLSELRRFQDGSINECVVFKCSNENDRKLIVKKIVHHLLHIHCNLSVSSISYHGNESDVFLRPQYFTEDTKTKLNEACGEEEMKLFQRTYETFLKDVRNIDDLPLRIHTMQGIDPAFRATEVIIPRQYCSNKSEDHPSNFLTPNNELERIPTYCPAYKIIVQFETSGKWPDDLPAIQHIKTAFQIKLARCIRESLGLPAVATSNYTDVIKNGCVFRLMVVHYREMVLCKDYAHTSSSQIPPSQKKHFETRARELDKIIVKKPAHTSLVNSLATRFIAYGPTVRLCKRWLSSQLLSGYFSDEAIELLVASIFLTPAPLQTPSSHLAGFLRFLHLLAKHDWSNELVFVDFNSEITSKEKSEIEEHFGGNREQSPALFISTNYDRESSVWTKSSPTVQILRRSSVLAQACLQVVDANISIQHHAKQLFRPSLEDYDVIIKLKPDFVTLHHYAIDSPHAIKTSALKENLRDNVIPVSDFDPVRLYYTELQEAFGDIAMFFFDQFGGVNVGVVWKKTSFTKEPFRIMNAKCRCLVKQSKKSKKKKIVDELMEASTEVNIEAIITDFKVIGQGIVSDVIINNERREKIEK